MSESQVIARRFRPQLFDQVVGQESITRTLANAIKSERFHHAYLFTGARGVGKTTTARILAKSLNCHNGITTEPCGVCASCLEIAGSRSIDVLEIDAASNTGVDNVRDVIINSIQIAPARDRNKIFIIDEVHMLSNAAFNALLKTLEEPPPRVIFILATTELQKVPDTILSRCQVFEFRTIPTRRIFEQLRLIATALNVDISDAALLSIARAGDGSMRDAESALDQVISFAGSRVTDEDVSAALGLVGLDTLNQTMRAIAAEDSRSVLQIVEDVVSRGYDLRNFCREMMVHTRALLVTKLAGFDEELVQMPQPESEAISALAAAFSEQDLLRFFAILTETEQNLRLSSHPRFQVEIGLIKLVQAKRLYLLEDAIERIARIETSLGVGPLSSPPRTRNPGPPSPTSSTESSGLRQDSGREDRMRGGEERQTRVSGSWTNQGSGVSGHAASTPTRATASYAVPAKNEVADSSESPEAVSASDVVRAANVSELEKVKDALRAKRKMLLVSAIEQAQSSQIDAASLRIVFAPEFASSKRMIDNKDTRQALEQTCREALGRDIRVSIAIVGEQESAPAQTSTSTPKRIEDATVQAIVDTFHGEIVEIVEPENKTDR